MDLSKTREFLNPDNVKDRIHIIGCGSVGSSVAELLSRYGFVNVSLYDFDTVQGHNLANQMFTAEDIGKLKVEAVAKRWVSVNPEANGKIKIYDKGWTGQKLDGYVFLCVDNIELRKEIVEANKYNVKVKAMFDFRTGLESAQHYAADWKKISDIQALLSTMDFSHEEAQENTPMSACKVALCAISTVIGVAMAGVDNFVNFLKGKGFINTLIVRPYDFKFIY